MADVAHKNLTGTDLHEPKGVADADADTVYVADGEGSGVWSAVATGKFKVQYNYYFADGTWSKPSDLIGIEVHAIGGGRGGRLNGASTTASASGTNSTFGSTMVVANGSTSNAGGSGGTGDTLIPGTAGDNAATVATPGYSRAVYGGNASEAPGRGGEATVTDTSGNHTATAGGGAEYAFKWFAEADLSSSHAVVVGQGGAAGNTAGGIGSPQPGNDGIVVVIEYIKV